MKEIKRVSAGVMFESDVLRFIDLLASDQQRTRSFIINQIIRIHARMLQQQKHGGQPFRESEEPPQMLLEPERPVEAINF